MIKSRKKLTLNSHNNEHRKLTRATRTKAKKVGWSHVYWKGKAEWSHVYWKGKAGWSHVYWKGKQTHLIFRILNK